MAIKVVQGLVDTGLGTRGAPTANANSASAQSQSQTGFATRIALQQQIQHAAQVSTAAASTLQSEAVVSFVRTHNITNESKKLKDSDTALELAETVADRVRGGEGEGLAAHNGLQSTNAREHFAS